MRGMGIGWRPAAVMAVVPLAAVLALGWNGSNGLTSRVAAASACGSPYQVFLPDVIGPLAKSAVATPSLVPPDCSPSPSAPTATPTTAPPSQRVNGNFPGGWDDPGVPTVSFRMPLTPNQADRMKKFLEREKAKGPNKKWNLQSYNCSNLVRDALAKGGVNLPQFFPISSPWELQYWMMSEAQLGQATDVSPPH